MVTLLTRLTERPFGGVCERLRDCWRVRSAELGFTEYAGDDSGGEYAGGERHLEEEDISF